MPFLINHTSFDNLGNYIFFSTTYIIYYRMTPASKALACADAEASLLMTKFIDACRLLGNYNDKEV
jgi:hypothetical protein